MIKKTRPHITQNEPLLFEISSPGKKGYQLPELDVPASRRDAGARRRQRARRDRGFPEVSEVEVIRHFTRFPPGTTPSISACIRWAPAP